MIHTARGARPFSPSDGYVLPHEHIIVDTRVWWEGPGEWDALDPPGCDMTGRLEEVRRLPQAVTRENLVLSDWYLAAKELRLARDSGCQLLADLTTYGLDPRHDLAVRAAALADIEIVLGIGRYLVETLTEADRAASVEDLTELWSRQAIEGINGFGAGIIGEIGTSEVIADPEITSLRAAARVQQMSGLAINVHIHPYARRALEALDVLGSEGADLSRVAVSHLDCELDVDWLLRVLERSCYVEMDNFGTGPARMVQGRGYPSDVDRIQVLKELCHRGYADRLLLSHDVCHRSSLVRYGGWGYAHLGQEVAPLLTAELGAETTHRLMTENPLRLLAVAAS